MAEIYLARVGDSDRLVVLKKLHPRLQIEPEYIQMFHDEAVIASKLHHPNLVEVYELGLDGEQHYIAMEYLHGHDLSRTLRRMRGQRLPLMFQQAITIVREVASGLHYAHELVGDDGNLLNIIHRDVSPHNVFLTYSGEVKVVDFGIAKANSQIARTRTGVLKGKVAYMSPEQAMGEPLDRRTDVFSIGILLWELTTGRWLYRRKSELETLKAVVETDAPRPSSVRPDYPKDLEKIVMKALARSAIKRWQTAGELRAALDELAQSWHFRPSALMIGKLMATAFVDEVSAWEEARAAGASLATHLITARPEVGEPADAIGTDPEEGVLLETRRAPMELLESFKQQTPAPLSTSEPEAPWWVQNRKLLLFSGIGVVLAAVLAYVAITLLGGSSGTPAPSKPGAVTPPPIETLEISPAAPRTEPPPSPPSGARTGSAAPDAGSGSRVPIVFPPPMHDRKGPRTPPRNGGRPSTPGNGSSSSEP
jgi:serine/threonine protein kinase